MQNEFQPFSYASIIQAAQLTALNSPTPPVAGSQQYLIFLQYIILAIGDWENTRNVLWNELWVDEPNYATLQQGTTTIALPDDFKFAAEGIVRLTYPGNESGVPNVLPLPIKRLTEIALNPYQDKREFYIAGNIQSGFQLVLGWPILAGSNEVGATISFRYYKYANIPQTNSAGVMTNPADVPEMSDPSYVYKVVTSMVAAANYNMNLNGIYANKAQTSLINMIQGNEMGTNYQDDYVKDVDALTGNAGRVNNRLNSSSYTGGL